jgi:hypothetical protein
MLLAYCTDRRDREDLRAALPENTDVEDWGIYERNAMEGIAQALIVFVRNLESWPHLAGLRAIRNRHRGVPITLITDPSVMNLVPMGRIEVDHILFPMQMERLPVCVIRKGSGPSRTELAEKLRAEERLTSRERAVLVSLFLAEPPPRTLPEWAKVAHASPSAIKYQLRRRPGRAGLPARVAININLLLAGLEVEPRFANWNAISSAVDVDARRLRAAVRALSLGSGLEVPRAENFWREVVNAIIQRLGGNDRGIS